jgi:putative tryptophan/tyrosine transport system substrate-binding protein
MSVEWRKQSAKSGRKRARNYIGGKGTVWTLAAMLYALSLMGAMVLALCSSALAQQAARIARIGVLAGSSSSGESPRVEAFRQGLRDLNYVEGKNLAIEYRYANARFDKLPALADELIQLKVDVLVVSTTPAVQAAKNATRTIPIVFFGVFDPVAAGLVESLARPGGNVTGFTNIATTLAGKRLELLKETVPKLSRVAVLYDPKSPGSVPQWHESQQQARELGLRLHSMEVSSADKFDGAFKEAVKARSAALAVTADPLANANRKQIADLATKAQLPAIYPWGEFVDNGGLMSYGPNFAAVGRDVARYVDKILKGTKPADLPVEQPTKFELVINLRTAKSLGLTIPPVVLMRAEKVIK